MESSELETGAEVADPGVLVGGFADSRSVHQRMVAVLADLPAIGKDQVNVQQDFNYRGHDDILNALNPLMAKHGVFVVPWVLDRVTDQRRTRSGSVMYEVNLHVRYTFYGANGDSVSASAWGEGTDTGDKSTNKAMTMAFKNVLSQAFAIATEETIDTDKNAPEETVPFDADPARGEAQAKLDESLALLAERDLDPAHGGTFYWEVAQRAAVRDYNKQLNELPTEKLLELAERFMQVAIDLPKSAPAPEPETTSEPPAEEPAASEPPPELPIEETLKVIHGPAPFPVPRNWAEVEQAMRAYSDSTWDHFLVFSQQARHALFPESPQRLSQDKKDVLFQKTAGVVVALREMHAIDALPPPSRTEMQAHWSKALDGTVLPGPDVPMGPEDTPLTRPAEEAPAATEMDERAAELARADGGDS